MGGFLGQLLIYVVPFLVVLTFIVTIHELGHFLTARAFKVKIDRFSIGFGRALLSRTDRHGVEWRIGWLPLGGYVKFAGDVDASSVPDEKALTELRRRVVTEQGPGAEQQYLHFKPVWQRALITAAGPAANFVLSFVLLTVLFMAIGEQRLLPRVAGVAPGSPAAMAGFQRGDLIRTLNDRPVDDAETVTRTVMLSAGTPLHFTVDRAGKVMDLVATPVRRVEDNEIAGRVRIARIGLSLQPMVRSDVVVHGLNPLQAAGKAVTQIGDRVGTTVTYVGRIFTGKESGDMLSGPLGIAKATGGITNQAARVEAPPAEVALLVLLNWVQLAALISIGIGFINLMPIPVLDGGHLVFYAYEAVARRPVAARVQEAGFRVGLALLACLMLFATWNDLQKLNLFKFLGGLVS